MKPLKPEARATDTKSMTNTHGFQIGDSITVRHDQGLEHAIVCGVLNHLQGEIERLKVVFDDRTRMTVNARDCAQAERRPSR